MIFNRPVLEKLIHTNELTFTELFTASPHIFIGKQHPLATKKMVSMNELEPYPYVSFEQGDHNSFLFFRRNFLVLLCAQNIYASVIGPPSLVY